MRPFEIGLVLPMGEVFGGGATSRWANIRDLALRAEEIGFDIVWTCDELLWRPPETNETETLDLFEGDGMTMGYHDWISGSFGDDPVLKPESSKLGRDQVRPPHPEH